LFSDGPFEGDDILESGARTARFSDEISVISTMKSRHGL
jgi:hypothetical protein